MIRQHRFHLYVHHPESGAVFVTEAAFVAHEHEFRAASSVEGAQDAADVYILVSDEPGDPTSAPADVFRVEFHSE
jgi:hypothetical protein